MFGLYYYETNVDRTVVGSFTHKWLFYIIYFDISVS